MKRVLIYSLVLMLIIPVFSSLNISAPVVTGNIDSFSDSASSKEVEIIKGIDRKEVGFIDIPNRAVITNAAFNVTSVVNSNYEYPKDIYLDVGDDGKFEWAFLGDGYGPLGQQRYFIGNNTEARIKIFGDSYNSTTSIRMPKNATITSTHMQIDGRANVSGADPSDSWTPSMKNWQTTKVAANISGGKIYFARYSNRYFDIYDPQTNSWSTSSSCTDSFDEPSHTITIVDSNIYVTMRTNTWPWSYKLYSYGLNNDTWTFHCNLPTSSASTLSRGGLTYDTKSTIYAIEQGWGTSSSVDFYSYSIKNNTWTKKASPPSISPRYPTICYLDGRVFMYNYTWGGSGNNFYFYAPNNNSWFRLNDAPLGIITKLCTDNYNVFGATAQGRILKYDVKTDTWAITGKKSTNLLSNLAGFAYSDRKFYLGRYSPSGGYYNITGLAGGDFPVNASLDIGDFLPTEWNITGEFNTTDYVMDFSTELNNIIGSSSTDHTDAYGNEFVDITINVTSEVSSEFAIREMFINYTYTEQVDINPSTGNLVNSLNELVPDTGEGNISLPIIIYSSDPGWVNITNISIDYFIPDLTNDRLELVAGNGYLDRIIYADLEYYTFLVNITNQEGPEDVQNVTVFFDIDGENIQLLWEEETNSFSELRDPKDLVTLDAGNCNGVNDTVNHWTLNFKVLFNWSYPNETLELCALNTTNDTGAWIFNEFYEVYRVENDLDLIGNLEVSASDQGKLIDDEVNNWVHASETIIWGNLTAVYEGTTNIYPDDKNFNITVSDDDSDKWMDLASSGSTFSIQSVSDAASDYNDIHHIDITEIPGLGEDVSNWTFKIKTDDDGPGVPSNIVCHADSQVDPQVTADNDEIIYVVWGAPNQADWGGSGIVEYAMEYNDPFPTDIRNSGDTATGLEGLATFYVRARDKVGNWGVTGSASIFIDKSYITYSDATPTSEVWLSNHTITASITINDIGGSGVNYDEVQFRKVDEGNITSGSWDKYTGPGETGEVLVCQQNITYADDGIEKKLQWRAKDIAGNGWTKSEILQFKIDSTQPTLNIIRPDTSSWLQTENPEFEVYINDTDGSGVEPSSLKYSISTTGLNGFGSWKSVTGQGPGEFLFLSTSPTFIEGDTNYIRFTAEDIAGNSIIFDPVKVKIDTSKPGFKEPEPSSIDWSTNTEIKCKITVFDSISSIDTSNLKYQYSTKGLDSFSHWKPVIDIMAQPDGKSFDISTEVKFIEGSDNYIRWSATDLAGSEQISENYNIQVDLTPVQFGESVLIPTKYMWSNSKSVPCSISINDTGGSGVLASSVEYSISTNGLLGFSEWTNQSLDIQDLIQSGSEGFGVVSEFIQVSVTSTFAEGSNNYIRWRGSDLAGNYIVQSEPQLVNIDLKGLRFKNPVPSEEQIIDEEEQLCQITIEDIGGSGIDPGSVEYRYSTTGPSGLGIWTNEKLNSKNKNTFFVYLHFNEGSGNMIMWRAKDLAGNGPIESKQYNITINSPPTAQIDYPTDGQKFISNEEIKFDASSSTDPDATDILKYQWQSNISMVFGDKETFTIKLPHGIHKITLTVDDGHGHSSKTSVEINIAKYIPPPDDDGEDTDGDDTQDQGEETEPKKAKADYSVVYILLLILIIVIILVTLAVKQRKKKVKEKLEADTAELASKMPVSTKASGAIQTSSIKETTVTQMPGSVPGQPTAGVPGQQPQLPPGMMYMGQGQTVTQHMVQYPGQMQGITPVQSYMPQPMQPQQTPPQQPMVPPPLLPPAPEQTSGTLATTQEQTQPTVQSQQSQQPQAQQPQPPQQSQQTQAQEPQLDKNKTTEGSQES